MGAAIAGGADLSWLVVWGSRCDRVSRLRVARGLSMCNEIRRVVWGGSEDNGDRTRGLFRVSLTAAAWVDLMMPLGKMINAGAVFAASTVPDAGRVHTSGASALHRIELSAHPVFMLSHLWF